MYSIVFFFIFVAEQELARLQQEYRIMEGDRKAYSEESQNIIRKQREAIDVLQKENEELMKDNRLAGSQQNQNNVRNFMIGSFNFLVLCQEISEMFFIACHREFQLALKLSK